MSSLRLGRQGRSRGVLLLLRVLQVAQPFGLALYCSVATFQSYGLGSQDLAKTRFVADALERSQAVVKRAGVPWVVRIIIFPFFWSLLIQNILGDSGAVGRGW